MDRWRIRREVRRLGDQAGWITEAFLGPSRRRRHDAALSEIHPTPGAASRPGERVAIFLIYQPAGLASSVLLTCRTLQENGFSVFLISNTPLNSAALDALRPLCWQILVRPNFGYDFGGYRDGYLHLEAHLGETQRLVLLNDSVWFPATDPSSFFEALEQTSADMAAPQVVELRRGQRKVAASYFLQFRKPAFASDAFRRFWTGYAMSSNKQITLHRGERGLSLAMAAAGFAPAAIYPSSAFSRLPERMDEAELFASLDYLVCLDPNDEDERLRLLSVPPGEFTVESSQEARRLLARVLMAKNPLGTSPVTALKTMRMPFLKKNREHLYVRARAAVIRAVQDGAMPELLPEITDELRSAVLRDARC